MTPALISAAAAFIGFTGTVPPHQAADGRIYSLSAPNGASAITSLRACGVSDFNALGEQAGRATFQFAVTAVHDADCVRSRLPAGARIDAKRNWSQ